MFGRKLLILWWRFYKATEDWPKEERYGLISQVRRAAVSVPANISEGAARFSNKEFAHFLSNAQGSASEAETELLIGYRLGYLTNEKLQALSVRYDALGKMLGGLTRKVRAKIN
ncbi:MAG TPA: four helix bundle protein [Pyrinomonadaceae bacterium]|nr:four helix bundle protein [Pyrinomonadaceae bacterium]